MTGHEHYTRAEELVEQAAALAQGALDTLADPAAGGSTSVLAAHAQAIELAGVLAGMAQAHATLSLALAASR